MTPYLCHRTWIDLDHVLAIKSELRFVTTDKMGEGAWGGVTGYPAVEMLIVGRDAPLFISVGEERLSQPAALIEAWKNRASPKYDPLPLSPAEYARRMNEQA